MSVNKMFTLFLCAKNFCIDIAMLAQMPLTTENCHAVRFQRAGAGELSPAQQFINGFVQNNIDCCGPMVEHIQQIGSCSIAPHNLGGRPA